MILRLVILVVPAVTAAVLFVLYRKLRTRLDVAEQSHVQAMSDAKIEHEHAQALAAREIASLARRNHELELALAQAQGAHVGLRTAAQDAHRAAAERIAGNEREMAELRLMAQMLWTIHERETYPEIAIPRTKRNGQRKALAASS